MTPTQIKQILNANNPETIKSLYKYLEHPQIKYRDDPVGFCKDVLDVQLWSKQAEIANALVKHRKVMVKSANSIGKSKVTACLALWFYATHDPGICLLTAPTFRQVSDITFKEIRTHYQGDGLYPKQPRIQSDPNHYIHGFTTLDATSFQGVHGDNLFIIFEECVGVDPVFWEGAKGILAGGERTFWLAVCNPTDNTSQAYVEEQSGKWHVISVSAFDHPNIGLELKGEPPLIPAAIRLKEVKSLIDEWCSPVQDEPLPTDFKLLDKWYRPGPVAEARLLGRYPKQSAYSIFSESDFDIAGSIHMEWHPIQHNYHIGVDIARFGDDSTVLHVRRGPVSIEHISYNKQDTVFTVNKIKQLCLQYAKIKLLETIPEPTQEQIEMQAKKIPVKVDDGGIGGTIFDHRGGFNFIPVNNASRATREDYYPNRRSEGLFILADLMRKGQIALSRLDKNTIVELKRQSIGITYKVDAKGKRVAEKKEEIKKRIGRSPDDLDAIVLAYLDIGDQYSIPKSMEPEKHFGKSIFR